MMSIFFLFTTKFKIDTLKSNLKFIANIRTGYEYNRTFTQQMKRCCAFAGGSKFSKKLT